jgi:hypothetical protein
MRDRGCVTGPARVWRRGPPNRTPDARFSGGVCTVRASFSLENIAVVRGRGPQTGRQAHDFPVVVCALRMATNDEKTRTRTDRCHDSLADGRQVPQTVAPAVIFRLGTTLNGKSANAPSRRLEAPSESASTRSWRSAWQWSEEGAAAVALEL